MLCAIISFLASPLICVSPDILPTARPPYETTFAVYGPTPDCYNADKHVRYLLKLKTRPVRNGEDQEAYDSAINQYIRRFQHYCQ
jgi:hypothetical protein